MRKARARRRGGGGLLAGFRPFMKYIAVLYSTDRGPDINNTAVTGISGVRWTKWLHLKALKWAERNTCRKADWSFENLNFPQVVEARNFVLYVCELMLVCVCVCGDAGG